MLLTLLVNGLLLPEVLVWEALSSWLAVAKGPWLPSGGLPGRFPKVLLKMLGRPVMVVDSCCLAKTLGALGGCLKGLLLLTEFCWVF